ncbi:MAG: hypothetical protein IPH20_19175 [Bacteroidales bacterium]|nr:hypothetical protein [Bacteroidales bacterium]
MKKISLQWNGAFSKLILIGQVAEGVNISRLLTRLSEDPSVVIVMETTSNIHHPIFINCIDRVIDGIDGAGNRKIKT